MRSFLTPLVLVFFPIFGLAAEPGPAKAPVPSNWVKMTNRANHFEYFVPPTWTHGVASDAEIQFQIPVNPKKNDFAFGMFVVAVRPTPTATLEDDAAEERKDLLRERPGAKSEITREGRVDFNGRPAWRFEYSEVREMTNVGGPLPPGMKPPKDTTRRLEILVHEGKNHFLILYQIIAVTNGAGMYNQFLPQAQQVFDSFKWNDSSDSVLNGPTAKLYHCKNIDVQIELPPKWSVEDPLPQSTDAASAVKLLSPEEEGEGTFRDYVIITASIAVDKSVTLERAVKGMFPPLAQPGVTNYKFLGARKVRFAGMEAYRGIVTGTIMGNEARFTYWLIVKDGRVYDIEVGTKKDTDPNAIALARNSAP